MGKQILRPPIVTVLGHVDHGKTSLLDKIRSTVVASKEAGGITQSIGASSVITKEGKRITFIDTPGHAAFAKMRSRGAGVCDIAILLVASDDGVQPQTKEALEHIKKAGIPYIVAINKVDLATSQPDVVMAQLEKEGVSFEGKGGNIPCVQVSAKMGTGIADLLETISLMAEVLEIKGNIDAPLEGVVIEVNKDRKGLLVSVIVRNGKLSLGREVFAGERSAKIKNLYDTLAKPVKEVLPGEAGQILGFTEMPDVGAKLSYLTASLGENKVFKKVWLDEEGKIRIIVKADNFGSLEAILSGLPKDVYVVDSGVGEVSESDCLMAKSSKARIFVFESKVKSQVLKLAETEEVIIERFTVIYELFKRLEEIIKSGNVEIFGKAQIIATFPFENLKVAGSRVLEGKITKSDSLYLERQGKSLGEIKIFSMKKQKNEIDLAKQGEEIGILFKPQLDFIIGDVLVSVRK